MIYDIFGNEIDNKSISILFIGNSMTQDAVSYVPYLLKTYFPEINFKFYLWYIAGLKLDQQYSAFTSNRKADIFSVSENSISWINYDYQKTINDVLSENKFNIVCMMEYFTGRSDFTESDLTGWTDCQNYIRTHYNKNPLEFITLFHAPSCNTPVDSNFELIEKGIGIILKNTICQDMIPCGIAKYRALDTELQDLGDAGNLTVDGGHAQEGLPCLLQALNAAVWILNKVGINKSIYNISARITTAIYNSLNVPGPNLGTGVITGTESENITVQEVAIKAFKEGLQFTIYNIFDNE